VRTDQAHQRYLEHQQANGAAPGPASQADAEATGAEATGAEATGAEAGPEPATPGGEARRDS
jgi:hypothetical protein